MAAATIGKELIESLNEAIDHAEGRDSNVRVSQVEVDRIDARAIRRKLRLTQDQMARVLGTSVSGYRKWEQRQREPSGAARSLLRIMEKEPEAVLRVLAAE